MPRCDKDSTPHSKIFNQNVQHEHWKSHKISQDLRINMRNDKLEETMIVYNYFILLAQNQIDSLVGCNQHYIAPIESSTYKSVIILRRILYPSTFHNLLLQVCGCQHQKTNGLQDINIHTITSLIIGDAFFCSALVLYAIIITVNDA